MDKDIGKIQKNPTTDIVIRIDDFGGRRGLTIREFVTSDKYSGFTKAGTRIPAESFLKFREMINSISLSEMSAPAEKSEQKGFKNDEDIPVEKPKKKPFKGQEELPDY